MNRLWMGPQGVTRPYGVSATVAFVVGGLLSIWSSYIHFHLWQKFGYRHIPTIGPLFIVQSVVGLVAGVLVIGVRRVWVGVVGAGFAVSTLVGFLVSVEHGLFGFKDLWSSPYAHQAFAIEMVTIVVLGIGILLCVIGDKVEHRATSALATIQS